MADFRFNVARDLLSGKCSFDHSMQLIAVSAVSRFMMCAGYKYLVANNLIPAIEKNSEGYQDALDYCHQFAMNLNQAERLDFCKSIVTLDFTIQQIQNGTAAI